MSYSENNSFELILNRILADDQFINVDKRVGSVVYDMVAPFAMEMAEFYTLLDIFEHQNSLLTATGSNLDRLSKSLGIERKLANNALRIAEFKKYKKDKDGNYFVDEFGEKILVTLDIDIGSRFVQPDDENIIFEYIGLIDGFQIVRCETAGNIGNNHNGQILPLVPIVDLVSAEIVDTYTAGADDESDENLRQRILDFLVNSPYGGNISDYIGKVNEIDGVGNTKVFPAWKGNGSVLLSVVDPNFNPITDTFKQTLKDSIDPEEDTGKGKGIAPIGHFVTITTPVKKMVDVSMTLQLSPDATISDVDNDIRDALQDYFLNMRKRFGQNTTLYIFKSKIIDAVMGIPRILNVTNVLLNGQDADIYYNDEGDIDKQYLPYLNEVTYV